MQMRDVDELFRVKDEAKEKMLWESYGIVYVLSHYHREVIAEMFGEDKLKKLDVLELAYESASKDIDECLSVEAEMASFKEESDAN